MDTLKALSRFGKLISLFLAFALLQTNVFGVTKTWNNGGAGTNWDTANNWSPSGVPAVGDDVVIPNSFKVDVTSAAVCNSLVIASGNKDSWITIVGTNSLTVTGNTTLTSNSNDDEKSIRVDAGTFTTGSLTLSAGNNDRQDAYVSVTTGIINVLGNIIMDNTAARTFIQFNGAGTLFVGGSMTGGSITSDSDGTDASTGTVNFNKAGAQTVGTYTYANLTISGSDVKTTTGVTVNGVFSREGTATASAALSYGAAATLQYKGTASQTTGVEFPTTFNGAGGVIINNAAGVVNNANHTITNDLTLTAGAFSIGAFTLTLNGTMPVCGTLVGGATSNLTISGISANTNIPAVTLNNLIINRTNGATLCGAVTVNGILTLTNGNLSLGDNNLTLGTSATIGGSPFNSSKMIETNGLGNVIKQSTTTGGFNITYPVGTGSLYNPMILSSTTGSVVGTATVSVRAVLGQAPNTSLTDLNKHWIVATSNLTLTSVNASFAYVNPNDVLGNASDYTLRYSTTPAVSWLVPNTPSGSGVNPMTTTGSNVLAGTWTAREVSQTWYTLRTGNWNDPTIWTLDPAGSLPNNPSAEYPRFSSDNVVIKNGRTVTMNVSTLTCKNLMVEGTLDLVSTTGHTFTSIGGNGRIRLSSNNWPAGDATHFITAGQGEGTVEFYGSSFSLTTPRTFFNMEVGMTSGQILTLLTDITLNGALEVKTGVFSINDATAAIRNLVVKGNVTVNTGASITTGTGKTTGSFSIPGTLPGSGLYHSIFHQFEVWGDFTNNGTVRFTNQTGPVYDQFTTTGGVTVRFKGLQNNIVSCNGTTDFYNLIVDKGTDQTYELELNASAAANFALYGPNNLSDNSGGVFSASNPEVRKALWIYNGKLKLTGSTTIPTLTEGGVDYSVGTNGYMWIASAGVSVNSTASATGDVPGSSGINTSSGYQAMTVYGTFRVSAGNFSTKNSAGLIFWNTANAQVIIEGGTTNVALFRSASGGAGSSSYSQSGGTLIVRGDATEPGELSGTPLFGLDNANCTFTMSGGEIQILDETSNANDIYLPSDPGNYNVTGGKMLISLDGGTSIGLYSTVPLYNLEVSRRNASGVATVTLTNPLTILNDITVGNNATFDVSGSNYDLSIGGNVITGATASTLNVRANTTTFIGGKNSSITNAAALTLNKVVVSKEAHPTSGSYYELNLAGAAQVNVANALTLTLGAFNTGTSSPNVAGNVVITNGVIYSKVLGVPSTGKMVLNGAALQTLDGAGQGFGSITLNNGNNGIQLLSAAKVTNLAFSSSGTAKVNMGTYGLTVDGAITNSSSTRYIYGAGNASDGGLKMYVSANGTTVFPVGIATKYTPASMTISGYSDDGYVTSVPVNSALQTTNPTGGALMPYYWKMSHSDFTTPPNVNYVFTYTETDNTSYIAGKVLDVSPFTRSPQSGGSVNDVVEASKTIVFSTPFAVEMASYTAGVANRFTGAVVRYYSNGGTYETAATWDRDSKGSGITGVPTAGSIVTIYRDGSGNGRVNCWAAISAANAPAAIVFEHDYATYPVPDGENVCRLQFWSAGTFNLGQVSGTGMVSVNAPEAIVLNADFGSFGTNPDSYYLYFGGAATLTSIPSPVPTIMFEGTAKIVNQNLTVNSDFIIQGGTTITPYQNVTIKRDLVLGMWSGGTLQFRGSGTPITLTVERNIDFTKDPTGTLGTRQIVCETTTTNIAHRMIVKGDIIHGAQNSSTFDLFNANNRNRVVLELAGAGTHSYSRSSTAVPDLYQVVMNKGVSQANTFTFNQHFTIDESANNTATKSITFLNGSLVMNNASFNLNLTSGGANTTIPSTAGLELKSGTYTATGTSGINLDGLLKVSGGTLNMTGGDNPIVISASGNAALNISAGTLNVGGQIRRSVNSDVGVLSYTQSGGTVNVGYNAATATTRGVFEVLGTGSNLTISGGDLYIVRSSSATVPALYLDPTTSSLAAANTIHIGSSIASGQTIGVYSSKALQNLDVLNGNTAKLLTVPLTLNGNLSITGGSSTLNANGLNLNIGGDFTNGGVFTSNANTTVFNGSTSQTITGTINFYRLSKTTSNTVTLAPSATIGVSNLLTIGAGTFNDNGNTVSVQGDVVVNGTHQFGGSGKGILMNGTTLQSLSGNGSIGKLTISNSKGVDVPIGNLLSITTNLRLEAGVFNIDKNLLTLGSGCTVTAGNPYSASNMIQTNVSFTDNGVKKVFPSGAGSFVFPIGSGGKYTPVTFTTLANGNSTGSITVKPAAENHVSVLDPTNVLQYYWTVIANGMSGFIADATMKYEQTDVSVTGVNTEADYITARLLSDGSGSWNKYSSADVNATTNILSFKFGDISLGVAVGDAEISGDYTAGINAAIPAQVPKYISIKNGIWSDASVWDTYPTSGGSVPIGGPRGSMAIVEHQVTSTGNGILSYTTAINGPNGNLITGTTYNHRLGLVSGTGTLTCAVGDLPAADFTDFFSAAGGTLEYNGSGNIDILTDLPVINSLKLSGTGTRKFPNINVQLLGGLTINGPVVDNDTYDKAISIKKNIVFDAGTFTAGNLSTAKVILNGTAAQTIGGTASFTTVTNDFNHLEINNTAGVTLNKPVDISGDLTLTAGVLTTTATNVLKLTSATATATGGKSTAYVSGPLVKQVSSGNSFTFPIGKGARYGALGLTTVSQTGLWKAEYFNNSPQNEGYNPASVVAPMASVSRNEYWNVLAPATATAGLTMRWDANSGVDPASSDMRATQYITTAWNQVALGTKTGNASGGSAPLAAAMSFNANAGGNYITFGSISLPAFSWIGTTSDWFTASNWNNAILPTATSNVTINTVVGPKVYPVIDPAINASLVQVKDLAIDPGATLTLMPGSKMTVNGNVTGADNSLIVQNTNLKPSSFINLGTVTPKVQVEWTYINGLQFWYIGHSVNGAIASDYGVLTGASRDVALYKWPTNWTGNTITTDATPLNETLMGYVAYFKNANTKVTTRGALNSGDITLTPMAAAWHLVANPYASYIDLDNTSQWDFGQALNSTWITTDITPGVRGFATYNVTLGIGANGGTGNVAPGQSFWIRTYTANDAFTIKSGARVHGAGALKSAKVNANDIFRLTIGNKVSQDELVMAFRSEGSDEVGVADSEKRLQAAANYPQVYSLKGEQSLAINTLPELNEDKVVPLGYLPVANEAIVIKATNLATFNPEVSVELEDKETGLFYDLRAVESVSVANSGAVANDERFALHFSRASKVPSNTTTTEIGEISKNDISITSAENKVVVEIKGDDTQQGVNVKMYAITGEKIIYDSFKGGYKQYALPTKSGHYVVSVTAKNAQGKTIEKRALVAVKNK